MTRTNKIKKKTSINPQTQISIKPIHHSGITKKKNAQYYNRKHKINNKKLSSKLLENIKTKKNIDVELKQYGGFLGLDYIALRWKMGKFLNIVKKLNESDIKFQKDIESYKLQAKLFEDRANKKAELQTQFIDVFRAKQMYLYYQADAKEAPKTKQSKAIIIQDSLKQLDNLMVDKSNRISQLDKEIGKDMKEYNRLMKEFKGKVSNFEKITSKYSKISNFQQEIEELKRAYDLAVVSKHEGLTEPDKKKIKKFEKHKEEYTKILSLTGQEIQNRIKIKQEIGDLQTTSEHYLDQFGTYEGKKKKAKGLLDIEFKNINCESGSGLLCDWVKQYTEFSSKLIDIDDMCRKIINNMKIIKKSAEICVKNLVTVFQKYDKDPQAQAMLRFEGEINELIKLFELAAKAIGKLKAEFYKQTPAVRINIDYNELTVEFNYIRAKLKVYVTMFDPNATDPTIDRKKTGGYRMIGGSGGRGRDERGHGRHGPGRPGHGGPGHVHGGPRTSNCNMDIYKLALTNKKFLEIKIEDFRKYKFLYDEIKDKTKNKDCFNDFDTFINIFNNYYQVWLFWLNVNQDLNKIDTTPIAINNRNSLKYFQIIKVVLEATETTQPTTTDKWFWNDDLKESIREIFAKIIHFEIPNGFRLTVTNNNLYEIFLGPVLTGDIKTIRGAASAATDLVCKMNNDGHPSNDPDDFYGVEKWDKEIGTSVTHCNPPIFYGNKDTFNNYLTTLIDEITDADYPPKYNPTLLNPTTTPNPATPQAVAKIQSSIERVRVLKNKIDNNHLLYQNDYLDCINLILMGLKKQEETGIIAANQNKLVDLLNRLEAHIDSVTILSPSAIANYKAEIALYNGWHLQPILNAYEIVKARYIGDEAKARNAADEVRKKIESGMTGNLAIQEVINLDEFKDPRSNPLHVIPGATVIPPPPAGTGTTLVTTTGASIQAVTIGKTSVKIEIDLTDVNLIKDVRRRIFLFGDYDVQLKNISTEYETIFKTLNNNLLEGSYSIKKMADTLQGLTQNLIELKYIEPKITGVTAKKDTSIRLPGADWIVPPAVKEFDKLQALSITKELQEARKKNRDMYKIYEDATSASSEELRKLFEQILINAGDKNKLANFFRVATNLDYLTKISDPTNFNKIIEMLKTAIPPGGDEAKNKACNILNSLSTIVGFANTDIKKIMDTTMAIYNPDAIANGKIPCFYEERKKDDKKNNKKHKRDNPSYKPRYGG